MASTESMDVDNGCPLRWVDESAFNDLNISFVKIPNSMAQSWQSCPPGSVIGYISRSSNKSAPNQPRTTSSTKSTQQKSSTKNGFLNNDPSVNGLQFTVAPQLPARMTKVTNEPLNNTTVSSGLKLLELGETTHEGPSGENPNWSIASASVLANITTSQTFVADLTSAEYWNTVDLSVLNAPPPITQRLSGRPTSFVGARPQTQATTQVCAVNAFDQPDKDQRIFQYYHGDAGYGGGWNEDDEDADGTSRRRKKGGQKAAAPSFSVDEAKSRLFRLFESKRLEAISETGDPRADAGVSLRDAMNALNESLPFTRNVLESIADLRKDGSAKRQLYVLKKQFCA